MKQANPKALTAGGALLARLKASKWDYELRFPEQVAALVDRAHAIANSTPKGPVYVALPREVLCETYERDDLGDPPGMQPARVTADPAQIADLAQRIASAEFPVILAQHGAGSAEAFAALGEVAENWAIPVCQYWAVQLALPTDHAMHAGADPGWLLDRADLVVVLDSLAPWSQQHHAPRPDAIVVQIGPDPLKARTPIRNFRSDISIAGELPDAVLALAGALSKHQPSDRVARRRTDLAARHAASRQAALDRAETGRDGVMSADYVAKAVSAAIEGRNAILLSERGCPMAAMTLGHHQAWYQEPHAGGLGWSFPAALGMQLADRERLVVATMGDGSYMFANPVACHQIAEALDLPLLVIVMNNAEWAAVRHSVLDIYPDGHAAKTNRMPLTGLSPSPDFVQVAKASRAFARKVETADALDDALTEALAHIAGKRGLALLDITIRN